MKPKQINKLYSNLTPHEQANLSFAAALRHDENEGDLIISSVEKRTYMTVHVDYHNRLHGLVQLSGIFGTAYWKTFFKLSTANLSKTGEAFDKVAQQHINEFISLNTALNNVCQSLQIDSEAIRTFAQCSDMNSDFEGLPFKGHANESFLKQYTNLFTVAVKD